MRLNVGVVFGGKSVEHEVSIISALQMIENMNKLLYQPITIYLSKENDFYYSEQMNDIAFFKNIDELKKNSKKVEFYNHQYHHELLEIINYKRKKLFDIDLIFLVVHGTASEDGTLSAYFELLGLPYVGSGILSSAINQNKWKMKQILDYNHIPLVDYVGFYESDYYKDDKSIIKKCEELGYPLIVKPACLGSSVGITKCCDTEGLQKAILTALQYDTEILVERVITNLMELNCSVLGDSNEVISSSVERVFQQDDILSYEDKYLRNRKGGTKGMQNTQRELPALIDDTLKDEVQKVSMDAFKIIGGSGVARVDFLYDLDEEKLYLNEINTIPGSLAFYLWKASGIEYKELIDRLISTALSKYRIRNTKISSYDSNLLSLPQNYNKGKLT